MTIKSTRNIKACKILRQREGRASKRRLEDEEREIGEENGRVMEIEVDGKEEGKVTECKEEEKKYENKKGRKKVRKDMEIQTAFKYQQT